MTYQDLCARLKQANIDSPEWDAALLLEHFCKVHPSAVGLDPTADYSSQALEKAVKQREARFPLQYILGEWSFYRQTYEVTPDCLIPRSDTEILVEEAIRRLPHGAHFADLCTGSGCIAISTLCERPDTTAYAIDKFVATLAVAMRNASKNGVANRLSLSVADVLKDGALPSEMQFDAILSNPPYIRTSVVGELAPEVLAEPAAALDGGSDGLLFYRAILQNGKKHLKAGGFFLFEIGFDQAEDITRLAKEAGCPTCQIIKDLSGNDRVAWIPPA